MKVNNIIEIKISDIDSFQNHPFLLNDDESFKELVNSIKENGLLNPIIVRPKNNGRYELISGHRRKKAMELIGLDTINAYIRDLNDFEATIFIFLIVYAIGCASTLKVLINGNNFGVKNSVKESLNIGELRATGNVTYDTEALKESVIKNYKNNNPKNINDVDFKIYLNNNMITVDINNKSTLSNIDNDINGIFAYGIYRK